MNTKKYVMACGLRPDRKVIKIMPSPGGRPTGVVYPLTSILRTQSEQTEHLLSDEQSELPTVETELYGKANVYNTNLGPTTVWCMQVL